MQWEALRNAYVERFGKLFDGREVEDKQARHPPFWLLVFWDPEVPGAPVVYASFGAPGREVYVVSAAPIVALQEALREAALVAPPSPEPFNLVRTQAMRTQFKGFLVAPSRDGSFMVGDEASGQIEVHRLVPVTYAERVLAADEDARAVYRRVREAGALAADPVRTCTVDPKRTEHWKKYDAPGLVGSCASTSKTTSRTARSSARLPPPRPSSTRTSWRRSSSEPTSGTSRPGCLPSSPRTSWSPRCGAGQSPSAPCGSGCARRARPHGAGGHHARPGARGLAGVHRLPGQHAPGGVAHGRGHHRRAPPPARGRGGRGRPPEVHRPDDQRGRDPPSRARGGRALDPRPPGRRGGAADVRPGGQSLPEPRVGVRGAGRLRGGPRHRGLREGRVVAQGFCHAIDLCRDFGLETNAATPFARLAESWRAAR